MITNSLTFLIRVHPHTFQMQMNLSLLILSGKTPFRMCLLFIHLFIHLFTYLFIYLFIYSLFNVDIKCH